MKPEISIDILSENAESEELYNFIENSQNGTIFHHPRFLSYHESGKYPDPEYSIAHMILRAKGAIVGFLPGMFRETDDGLQFNSPSGASFGGIVTGDISFEKCERIVDAVLEYLLKKKKVKIINLAPVTGIYTGDQASDYLEYMYLKKGFTLKACELTIAARISQRAEFPADAVEHRVRKFVAQSEKGGVLCRISDDVDTAYSIIKESRKRFEKKPTHSLAELKAVSKLFPGRIVEFIAYKDEEPIAAACLMLCNRNAAYSFYIDQAGKHSALRPVDHIVNRVLIWLKERGYRYLDFGPSSFGYEPHRSLIFFKEGFNGRGVLKRFYQYRAAG